MQCVLDAWAACRPTVPRYRPNQTWTRTAAGEIKAMSVTRLVASPRGAGSKCPVTQFTVCVQGGVPVWSPDGSHYFLDEDDRAGR